MGQRVNVLFLICIYTADMNYIHATLRFAGSREATEHSVRGKVEPDCLDSGLGSVTYKLWDFKRLSSRASLSWVYHLQNGDNHSARG